ncbi:MAG: hypothetical protein DRQ60_03555 [Gammaproteobacteria bacterium]|nr:MAG: hypothetical protein DRQ54_02810 [Gammaproteobacteria bacterium]RLA16830.1 MAG: hypothetical protein DRQ60_03555 [Gammaproteobacteria bacterium]
MLVAGDNRVNEEIEYLLQSVGQSGCIFVRNGSEHSSENAESHLRLKYRKGKKYAKSAEQFINRLATKSSWTGNVYYLSCEGEERRSVGEWLTERLAAYKQSD